MALTFTSQEKPVAEGHRWRTVTIVACDNSYPTGGWSCKPTDLGLGSNNADDVLVIVTNTYGYSFRYDYSAQKLMTYSSAGTETTNATDLSALTDVRVVAYSKYRP